MSAARFLRRLLVVAAAAALRAQPGAEPDPVEILMRLRDRVDAHMRRIPNYTCIETIVRDHYEPATRGPKSCDALLAARKQPHWSLKLETTDRLRLDVALAADREIYSWAGARKFYEGGLDLLVPGGATGTGPFASMLVNVFADPGLRFIYQGDSTIDGRAVFEYEYYVPREKSSYQVKAQNGDWTITAYTGTLIADAHTAELVRLLVRTDELEPATSLCEADTRLEYGSVQLGGGDYLLPKIARQRFISRDGAESENGIVFSACREFQAESKLTFGAAAPGDESNAAAPGATPPFPASLAVTIDLAGAIRADEAAAGDRIEGRLAVPVRDAMHNILAPAGTRVHGRLMRVEIRHSSHPDVTIALRWTTIDLDGVTRPLVLVPNRASRSWKRSVAGALRPRGLEIELPQRGEESYGVFHFPDEHAIIRSGLRTEWYTGWF